MRTPRLSSLVLAALLLGALALGCKKEDDPAPPPACALAQLGAACAANGDCCSGNCYGSRCIEPVGQCGAVDDPCALPSDCCLGACNSIACVDPNAGGCEDVGYVGCDDPTDCCTGNCASGVCAEPQNACLLVNDDCTAPAQCCTGICTSGKCAEPTTATCRLAGVACTSDSQCCSAACDATGHCANAAGVCGYPGEACTTDSDCCSQNCPNAGTAGATCSSTVCRQVDQTCADDGQCCSGICGFGNLCDPIPAGSTGAVCKTLGEACASGVDCCSTNCQGGTCKPAAACNAFGDVCSRPEDCCSGLCAAPVAPGDPGRCDDAPGGCALDGYPCTNDSGCCTRKCVDLGTGAKVCQPSGGCRLNGNYCDSTAACCNVNYLVASSQWVNCDPQDHVCDNGGSCNPPGDICGLNTNASQNCCFGKKDVCKYDMNGIPRCFGGCPTNDCTQGPCPTGWDGNDPQCCIPAGDVCQFRDQCCGLAPCVPDAQGVLRCAETAASCIPRGAICTSGAPQTGPFQQEECCDGSICRFNNELGWRCASNIPPGTTCVDEGASCASAPCCFGTCDPTTRICGQDCEPNGSACAGGSECCSGVCEGNVCRAVCVGEAGSCTVTADCCTGLTCDVPAGATAGTCTSGGTSTCAQTGDSCDAATNPCCNAADTCTAGVCTPPAPACSESMQRCTFNGNECCQPLDCYASYDEEMDLWYPCDDAGDLNCFCAIESSCLPMEADCTAVVDCCGGVCRDDLTLGPCTSADPTKCSCKPVG